MKLFNIDMHISIIHDVKHILEYMGHQVDSVCMSGHTWVNKEKQGATDIVTPQNWKNIDSQMCNAFYKRYKTELDQYDAFITSYPPAFGLLFEKWNKPIIVIACTRFDYPCVEQIDWLITGLNKLYDNKQLIPVANNLFDKKYCEIYTGFEWVHIQSLCDYMNTTYQFTPNKKIICWKRCNITLDHPFIDNTFSIYRAYDRSNIIKSYNGIIHIPYNISIMSAFEHYYSNMPLFVPTVACLEKWAKTGYNILSELYFTPHIYKINKEWLEYADWLCDSVMKHTIRFNSVEELYNLISETDLKEISTKMSINNKERRALVYKQWKEIIDKI